MSNGEKDLTQRIIDRMVELGKGAIELGEDTFELIVETTKRTIADKGWTDPSDDELDEAISMSTPSAPATPTPNPNPGGAKKVPQEVYRELKLRKKDDVMPGETEQELEDSNRSRSLLYQATRSILAGVRPAIERATKNFEEFPDGLADEDAEYFVGVLALLMAEGWTATDPRSGNDPGHRFEFVDAVAGGPVDVSGTFYDAVHRASAFFARGVSKERASRATLRHELLEAFKARRPKDVSLEALGTFIKLFDQNEVSDADIGPMFDAAYQRRVIEGRVEDEEYPDIYERIPNTATGDEGDAIDARNERHKQLYLAVRHILQRDFNFGNRIPPEPKHFPTTLRDDDARSSPPSTECCSRTTGSERRW